MLAVLIALAAFAAPAQAAAPTFTDPGPLSSDTGHVLIEWQAEGPVTLIIARDESFAGGEALYRGYNHSFFLSGLAGGDYYLLLRDEAGQQSAPVKLSVVHQSLTRAIWLTIIGAFIALAIVATILRGARP